MNQPQHPRQPPQPAARPRKTAAPRARQASQAQPTPSPGQEQGQRQKQKQNPRKPHQTAQEQALQAIRPGQSVELLKALHILTRDGTLNQDSRRKLKQVYHLFGFIEPLLRELHTSEPDRPHHPDRPDHTDTTDHASTTEHAAHPGITLADHGAGKSYLGFILYDLFFRHIGTGTIYGIETRAELVDSARQLAERLGFVRMQFLPLTVAESAHSRDLPAQIDIVTALHACDTATDDAIAFGLRKQARHMVLVPCCQAEAAGFLRRHKALQLARTPLAELWRHPLHTRELGSQITNVLRCLYLESQGYQVTVTELVGWEHSLKNELILARHTGQKKHSAARRMAAIAAELGLQDWLQLRFPLLDG